MADGGSTWIFLAQAMADKKASDAAAKAAMAAMAGGAAAGQYDPATLLCKLQTHHIFIIHQITYHTPHFKENLIGKKISSRFRGCCKNALIQSFKTSPHLIVWILNP